MDRLAVICMGNRNSGKSSTWNALFGQPVRTGKYQRALALGPDAYVNVFLASGSPEERQLYVGKILTDKSARIVLCSMQYTDEARQTIGYFLDADFALLVHWLNPGYRDHAQYPDTLGLASYLLFKGARVAVRNGQKDLSARTEEMRQFIRGWAEPRGLVRDTE